MKSQILVISDNLQDAVNYFVDYIKENLKIDLNQKIINEKKYDEFIELADECFTDYEIYNHKLFALASDLYHEGYNVLEKAIEWEINNPMIINEVLRSYVMDVVQEYQQKLKNNQEKIIF